MRQAEESEWDSGDGLESKTSYIPGGIRVKERHPGANPVPGGIQVRTHA